MVSRVLLIGQGIFRDGLARLLAEQPSVAIIGAASTWSEASAIAARARPDVLIVDHASAELREADLAPLIEAQVPNLKVIYITLADNKMIVHNRQVANLTLPRLLQAIQTPKRGQRSSQSKRCVRSRRKPKRLTV